MPGVIAFLIGLATGATAGWMLLFLLMANSERPKEPPTKDEWKVM